MYRWLVILAIFYVGYVVGTNWDGLPGPSFGGGGDE